MRTVAAKDLMTVSEDFYPIRIGMKISVPTIAGTVTGEVEDWLLVEGEIPIWRNPYEQSGYQATIESCQFKLAKHGWVLAYEDTPIEVHE